MTHNPIGLGTAAIGRPQYINIRQEETADFSLDAFRRKGMAILDEAYAQGVRYFDTAPGYGMAEQMLIDWLATKNDPTIELATKWGYTYVANFDPNATQHEVKEHSLAKLNEQWQQSQALLPALTSYQIHSATFETGVLDSQAVLERLAELKATHGLHIGLSTTGNNQREVLEKSLTVEVAGEPLFDLFQVTYNIFDQSLREIIQQVSAAGKRVAIKEALANGRVFSNESYVHYQSAYQLLASLAEKYQVGTDAIALRFCLDSVPVYKVLSGAGLESHLQANTFSLTEQEIEILSELAVSREAYWAERQQLGWN